MDDDGGRDLDVGDGSGDRRAFEDGGAAPSMLRADAVQGDNWRVELLLGVVVVKGVHEGHELEMKKPPSPWPSSCSLVEKGEKCRSGVSTEIDRR